MDIEHLQYPIGKFEMPETVSEAQLKEAITILEIFPEKLKELMRTYDQNKLDSPYRPGGWTVRQVVHHIADSHHHSYNRFKWAITEDNPLIKAYDEKRWAETEDCRTSPIAWSLTHIEVVHQKLVQFLRTLSATDWDRTYRHPESKKTFTLKQSALLYAWHSMHHYSHIANTTKE
ncbi:MAG: putative metal-dependent hydrolase [Flavobacteriales bacterium]|jgi:hypothetical protein|uniref:YfiT family bacillithiol transferase n=1 Tax=Candidatus Ulvibacter alkanivorans TaxID=2267620 RepID=UPI000DF390C8|nr:putative metal-dependent hydrolase [Candidatus Ulvibacter alkanivorans]MCH2488505.1 putative metal-dependent hydrolase [Flavobacteriales bacterium]